jgi:molybdenum cofactor synthesis domain-containing protein
MTVSVITVSDRASTGEGDDQSGPAIEKILRESFSRIVVSRSVVPDAEHEIRKALESNAASDFIFTTGGTGIGPRDITPDVTERFCDRALPGIAEVLRAESYKQTRNAMISRAYAGLKGKCIVVNFPGSLKAVRLCTRLIVDIMEHAREILEGHGH